MYKTLLLLFYCLLLSAFAYAAREAPAGKKAAGWTTRFTEDKEFLNSGSNDYYNLHPGFESIFEGKEEGAAVHLVITVLNKTKKIGNVLTRVIEEHESKNGKLIEVSHNYFAIGKKTHNVYYFGEDVDIYSNGKIVSHNGSWKASQKGFSFGMIMPSHPTLGAKFYQEYAPKTAMDRAEIISVDTVVTTPAGEFKDCIQTEETTPLEPSSKEYKVYAKHIGLVQDGTLYLVKYGVKKRSN